MCGIAHHTCCLMEYDVKIVRTVGRVQVSVRNLTVEAFLRIRRKAFFCGMDRLLKSEEGVSMYEKIQGRIAEKTGIIMNIGGRR